MPQRAGLEARLARLEAARLAAEEIGARLREMPGCADAEVSEVLKHKRGEHAVLAATIGGEAVIVKWFAGPKAARIVRRQQRELTFAAAHLGQGPYQVNRSLMAFPDAGLAVLSFAPGERLRDHLAQADPERRAALLQRAGGWLKAYCAPRLECPEYAPGRWIERMAATDLSHLGPQDAALMERLKAATAARGAAAKGVHAWLAPGHSDFVDLNMLWDGRVLTGVDIQGENRQLLARMSARFLVWLTLRGDREPTTRIHGLDRGDVQAFLQSDVLSENEKARLLPVFIGEQLFARFVQEFHAQSKRRANAVAAINGYLAGD
ncbi:hypothetical protein U5922_006585 [Aquicoccus sp. G2-2]|uniref:hypothetical protein n=1 Tax=Aquicoccus sp. G2-2 TaxID=3092120 RepID=UPI002ADFAA67|nr:hypothetical protein [Aquicoccus sp. G2-2]MEA1113154.1 hypothetical protein [Aquicoccus sp. G2-2]